MAISAIPARPLRADHAHNDDALRVRYEYDGIILVCITQEAWPMAMQAT
ncbi:MAG: hypothetical protein ACOY9J_07360 [Pseudomonadota bacterium]